MVLGCYYLTIEAQDGEKGTGTVFKDSMKCYLLIKTRAVSITLLLVKMRVVLEDGRRSIVESTVGRFIFNENIPQDLGFVDRRMKDPFGLEIDFLVDKKSLGKIIDKCFRRHGNTETCCIT